jgi:transposase
MNPTRRSTLGRPRRITDAQVAEILAWAAARMTVNAKARELGVSPSALRIILKTHGTHYKQPSPERRTANQHHVSEHRAHLRKEHWL